MKDVDMQIASARFEHVLNTSLSQVRVVNAHLMPVAQQLDEQSEERRYVIAGLVELTNLHAYIMHHLNELATGLSDPTEAARAVLSDAQEYVAKMEVSAGDAQPSHGSPEVSIH